METNELPLEQPRQYGDEVHSDQGLAQLAQARNDEEAIVIEAALLIETDEIAALDELEEESP